MTSTKLSLTEQVIDALIDDLLQFATVLGDVPNVITLPFDAKDNVRVDVAVASGAAVIASRELHLLNLVDPTRAEAAESRRRFPDLDVLTPTQLLARVRPS